MNNYILTFLVFLLSGSVAALSAQEAAGSVPEVVAERTGLALSGQEMDNSISAAAQGCLAAISNLTLSSTLSVMGCSTLTTTNITVTSTGNLTLKAPTSVLINPTFLVQSGGTLYVGQGKRQRINYEYDLSGNRTVRYSLE